MKNETKVGCVVYGFIGLIVLILLSISLVGQFNSHEYNVTVTDKVVKQSKESSKYLIFTETDQKEVRVFQDTDSLFRGKWNSSDIYAEIKVNQKYKFKVYGFRIPFLSHYENIVSIEKE